MSSLSPDLPGEQDFLNAFWRGDYALLSHEYHCIAEDFGDYSSDDESAAEEEEDAGADAGEDDGGGRAPGGADDGDGDGPRRRRACAVAEFASCAPLGARGGAAVAWKPWHARARLAADGFRVCRRAPSKRFRGLVERWRAAHGRALATLDAAGVAPPALAVESGW